MSKKEMTEILDGVQTKRDKCQDVASFKIQEEKYKKSKWTKIQNKEAKGRDGKK
jgi:hypothetical protein